MNSRKSFLRFSRIIVFFVFLVILAGGVVRMTQSGMGCPDWPKCFGSWIPPISISQLPANYKELYAFRYVDTSFNPYHTWIEYINRLLGALLGLLLIIQFFLSLSYWRTDRKIVWFCLVTLLLTGFQGWLGSKVVETNLEAFKITTHMLVALLIAALAVTIVHKTSSDQKVMINTGLKNISWLAVILLTIQICLGTQVREEIDRISVKLNFDRRELWISKLDYIFYIHRSFSIVIAITITYLFFQLRKNSGFTNRSWLMFASLMMVIILGLCMSYLNIPPVAQPLHLLFSSMLIIIVYFNSLSIKKGL